MAASPFHRNPRAKLVQDRWSHGLAGALAAATLLLLAAGALVTSTGSSLAVPDWPLAYGELFPPMVGGILYEHGHRLIAAAVGLMTVALGGWLWWAEERMWVKVLGSTAVALVILQGVLGGLTVIFLLPKVLSIAHALTAQLFFLLTVVLYQVTEPGWTRPREPVRKAAPRRLRILALAAGVALFIEALLGATVRHQGAGLAIPDFPLAYGGLVPPLSSLPVAIHFLHRVGALVVAGLVVAVVWTAWAHHRDQPRLLRPANALGALLLVQVMLGGMAIWSRLAVPVTTLHVLNGALLLGTAGLLTLRARRLELAARAEPRLGTAVP